MLEEKYNAALSLLEEHNKALGGLDQPGTIDPQQFLNCIKASGGTSEERLKALSYEDILVCLPETNGVKPVIIAKALAKIFRGKDESISTEEKRPVSKSKASKLSTEELLQHYDPEDGDSTIATRLKELSRGYKCIVFTDEKEVDVLTSKKLLSEIRKGFSGRESIEVNDKTYKVYHVGEIPDNYVDENPLYPGRPLRPDGTCDQLNRSWEGVPLNIRQFIRIAINSNELKIDREKAHDILDLALNKDLKSLRRRYSKAALAFDELEKTGDLPKLKILLGKPKEEGIFTFTNPSKKRVQFVKDSNVPYYVFDANQNKWYSR